MQTGTFLIYLAVMAGVTYLIRVIPYVAMRKEVKNVFFKSVLYYIPYTVLAAMTFPSALYATGGSVTAAAIGLAAAILVSLKTKNLTVVAVTGCVAVFLAETLMAL